MPKLTKKNTPAMDTEEKKQIINEALSLAIKHSEFNVADLSIVRRHAQRFGIDQDDVQQYIATLEAAGLVHCNVVGRSYYIVPKNIN